MRFDVAVFGDVPEHFLPAIEIPRIYLADRSVNYSFRLDKARNRSLPLRENIKFFWLFVIFPTGKNGDDDTVIDLRVEAASFDDDLRIAVIDMDTVEIEWVRKVWTTRKTCLVTCADGTAGNPCALCTVDGKTVRFCC